MSIFVLTETDRVTPNMEVQFLCPTIEVTVVPLAFYQIIYVRISRIRVLMGGQNANPRNGLYTSPHF